MTPLAVLKCFSSLKKIFSIRTAVAIINLKSSRFCLSNCRCTSHCGRSYSSWQIFCYSYTLAGPKNGTFHRYGWKSSEGGTLIPGYLEWSRSRGRGGEDPGIAAPTSMPNAISKPAFTSTYILETLFLSFPILQSVYLWSKRRLWRTAFLQSWQTKIGKLRTTLKACS